MAYIANFSQSNQADWIFDVVATNADTGDAVDFSAATAITFEVNDFDGCRRFVGALSSGVTLPAIGTIEVLVPKATMQNLCAGSYPIGMTYTMNGETDQILIGTVSVYDGVAKP